IVQQERFLFLSELLCYCFTRVNRLSGRGLYFWEESLANHWQLLGICNLKTSGNDIHKCTCVRTMISSYKQHNNERYTQYVRVQGVVANDLSIQRRNHHTAAAETQETNSNIKR